MRNLSIFNSDGVLGNDKSLVLVNPETIVRWHRAGFRLYWSLISRARRRVGRKKPSKEVRDLIFQMVAPEPDLGSASHSRGFSNGGNRRSPHATQQQSQGERRRLRAGDGRECHARI
jgi:putative transposase